MRFKFREDNHKYIWEDDHLRLEYSNPQIQGFDEFAYLKDEKGIMYFYYTVNFYAKTFNGRWKKIATTNTHDFPCIEQLCNMIEYFAKHGVTDEECQKIEYSVPGNIPDRDKNVEYRYSLESSGIWCDDFYQLERIKKVYDGKETENFNLHIGLQQFDIAMNIGTKIEYLDQGDLSELILCTTKFIKYALDIHNEEVRKANKEWANSMKAKNKKLYSMGNEIVKEVYTIGSVCNITRLIGNLDENNFSSQEYIYAEIIDIVDDYIIVNPNSIYTRERRCVKNEEERKVPLNEILYISEEVPKNRLSYKVDEIVKDWVSILDNEEKDEFSKEETSKLAKKWTEAIIDRSWMCRNEHNYADVGETDNNYEKVRKMVERVVIPRIKTALAK